MYHTKQTKFAENKYFFSEHLRRGGDWVRTHPLSAEEVVKYARAAYDWAWQHKWTIEVSRYQVAEDKWEVEVELTSKFRDRDFG